MTVAVPALCRDPVTRRYTSGRCSECRRGLPGYQPCILGKRPKPPVPTPIRDAIRAGVDPTDLPVICPDCGDVDKSTRRRPDPLHAGCRRDVCRQCGGLYSGYGKSLYCSAECRDTAIAERRRLRRTGTTVPTQAPWAERALVCTECGGGFTTRSTLPVLRCVPCREAHRLRRERSRRKAREGRAL